MRARVKLLKERVNDGTVISPSIVVVVVVVVVVRHYRLPKLAWRD